MTAATDPTNPLNLGYQYRDVVSPATYDSTSYTVGSWAPNLTVSVTMRDMMYLSHANTTNFTTTDANVMQGTKEMDISLDFNQLLL